MTIKERLEEILQSDTPKIDLQKFLKEFEEEQLKRKAWTYAEENMPEGRMMLVDLYEAYMAGTIHK